MYVVFRSKGGDRGTLWYPRRKASRRDRDAACFRSPLQGIPGLDDECNTPERLDRGRNKTTAQVSPTAVEGAAAAAVFVGLDEFTDRPQTQHKGLVPRVVKTGCRD